MVRGVDAVMHHADLGLQRSRVLAFLEFGGDRPASATSQPLQQVQVVDLRAHQAAQGRAAKFGVKVSVAPSVP